MEKINWVWRLQNCVNQEDTNIYFSRIYTGKTLVSSIHKAAIFSTPELALRNVSRLHYERFALVGLTDKELFKLKLQG